MTQEDYICNRKVQFDGGNEFQLRLDEGAMIPVMTILGVCNPNRRKMMCHIFAMPSHISCEQPSILCCVLPQFVPYFLPSLAPLPVHFVSTCFATTFLSFQQLKNYICNVYTYCFQIPLKSSAIGFHTNSLIIAIQLLNYIHCW